MRCSSLLLGGLLCVSTTALAQSPADKARLAQQVELERIRGQIANQLHLTAFDLIDELVWRWSQESPFSTPTPVVVADVSVPVGLGTALQAQVENHLGSVIGANPATHISLSHCPQCTAVLVHSGPEGTVVSRGIDNPATLEALGANAGQHALFLDFEAEGSSLVLRARITRLTPELPIVHSTTLSSAANQAALLRQPNSLKSAAAARQEYLDVLGDRGLLAVPFRIGVRSYAAPSQDLETPGTPPPPFLWLQTGVEYAPTSARLWTSSFLVGGSFIPQAYKGLMGQVRISRLVSGRARSHIRPDAYLFLGGTVTTVWGASAASFSTGAINADNIVAALSGAEPRSTFGSLHAGVDLRLGNRMGLSAFLETLPTYRDSDNIGEYITFLGVEYHSLGVEVSFWF